MASRKHPAFGASPRADLLPDAQRAEIHHEQTLPKLLLALIASAVVAGLIWAAGMIPVMFAQQERAALQTRSAELSAEIARFEDAATLLQSVGSRETDRQTLTAEEVLFMELRDDIQSKFPSGTSFAKFTATLPTADDVSTEPDEDCIATGAVATIVMSTAEASALSLAASFIDGMDDIEGFLCGQVVDSHIVSGRGEGAVSTTEVQIRATFDDTVRVARFAQEDAS